jgi:hypothetical protein
MIAFIADFLSNPEKSDISSFIKSIKSEAQVSEITFLILNFKSLIK